MNYINQSENENEFYNSAFNERYLVENKNTKYIPAYIRDYPKFIRLLKLFSNYIQVAAKSIESILSQLNLNNASGNVLEKIAERLDIYIEKPLDSNGNIKQDLYESQLRIAILGNGLKKESKATRASIMKILDIFKSIIRIEVTDFSNSKDYPNPMTLQLDVVGNTDVWDTKMLEKYVFPDITGVNTIVTYLLNNDIYFGFDRNDIIVIVGSINIATQDVTQTILNNKAEELGVTPKLGTTITDSESNGWVFMDNTVGWKNKGTVVDGEPVVNESEGYGVRGWDLGKWAQSKITK